jgi:hypothetical protein
VEGIEMLKAAGIAAVCAAAVVVMSVGRARRRYRNAAGVLLVP